MIDFIPITNGQAWDSYVRGFKEYDVYYTVEYMQPFSEIENSEMFLVTFKDNDFELCYPIEKFDISDSGKFGNLLKKGELFDLSTPYGYGGPLIKNYKKDSIKKFFDNLKEWANENNIVSQFLRFHPLLENHKYFEEFCDEKTFKQTVYMDLTDEDTIYKNMNDKCRNMVKKALRNGIEIKIDNTVSAQNQFIELYKSTMIKNNASEYYFFNDKFFNGLFKGLGINCNLFNAIYDGKTVSSAIIFATNKFLHYHLSAQNREFSKFGANNLLLYEVARYGAKKGFSAFHLGGGVEAEDGLYIFKKSFNKKGLKDFYIGRNIFDFDKYNYLMQKRKAADSNFNLETNYMIGYRA